MSYDLCATGTIEITPPVPWGLVKDSPYLQGHHSLRLVLVAEDQETPQGVLNIRSVVAVQPTSYESSWPRRAFTSDLQKVVDAYPEHEFTGYLEFSGEDPGDLWRLEVIGRTAVHTVPTITWLDGSVTIPGEGHW